MPPISAPRTRPSPVRDAGVKPDASWAKPGSCSNCQLICGFAPKTEIEARDQLSFDGPPDSVGARSLFEIMVGHAAHDAEPDATAFEELQSLRRTVDESGQATFINIAATEKPHIGEDFIAGV